MIEVIRTLLNEKKVLNETFPVVLNKQTYFIKVGDLIENAADLNEDRIELHANRLIKAYSKNDREELIFALWMLGREVLHEKPELAASLNHVKTSLIWGVLQFSHIFPFEWE